MILRNFARPLKVQSTELSDNNHIQFFFLSTKHVTKIISTVLLSSSLTVIFDYKQRLERSLKTEKAEHQQSKTDLETKLKSEKKSYEKANNEAKLQYTSLQQHYNLLQVNDS